MKWSVTYVARIFMGKELGGLTLINVPQRVQTVNHPPAYVLQLVITNTLVIRKQPVLTITFKIQHIKIASILYGGFPKQTPRSAWIQFFSYNVNCD